MQVYHRIKWFFCTLFFLSYSLAYGEIFYNVDFIGLKDEQILKDIKNSSQLISLQKHPPRSVNGLKHRAEIDVSEITKIMKSYGYFDALISFELEEYKNRVIVYILIEPGERYHLSYYNLYSSPCAEKKPLDLALSDIGVELNKPLTFWQISDIDTNIVTALTQKGYPLASVKKKVVYVNSKTKTIGINQCVEKGGLAHFGPITIVGLKNIDPRFIEKKIQWKEGEIYSSQKVEETQMRLLSTQLFSSAMITHDKKLDKNKKLPMKIHLTEALHRNINFGVNYATVDGFGTSFGWKNRNLRGLGETLDLFGDISQRSHRGSLTYVKPDVFKLDQNYVLKLIARRQRIRVYRAYMYTIVNRLDSKINNFTDMSIGIKGEYDDVTHSINDGKYWLLGLPTYVKYSTANHMFNPTSGITVTYQPTPYENFKDKNVFFLKQRLICQWYWPFTENRKNCLAFRVQFGSIVGAKLTNIPMTKLFFGGSDDDLRGYRYWTVSPLNKNGDPTGGRSAIYCNIEPRFRVTEKIGIVPFFDIGNVQRTVYPTVCGKWHKSVGIGVRYFTFFGPLRLDVGFPLDRRKFDPRFRFYGSIGQTF